MMSVLLVLGLLAGTPAAAWAGQEIEPDLEQVVGDYQLGPGDVLQITVTGVREFNQLTRVSNSGRIRVPYVGVTFVAGMTALEVEQQVAKLIMEHELVTEPIVRVEVQQHRARPTYVIGEVNAPGQFMITGEMYLLDILSKAGGLLPTADDFGYLYRRNWPRPSSDARIVDAAEAATLTLGAAPAAAGSQPAAPAAPESSDSEEVLRVNLNELRAGTSTEQNVRLQGGDVLFVPRRRGQNIYIIGDVVMPGAYMLPRRGEITASQAIIYAGGPTKTASMKSAFLMRHNAAGEREAFPIHFADIIDGKQPDIPVKADDIIFVPNSTMKYIGVGLLNLVPRLIQQFLIF